MSLFKSDTFHQTSLPASEDDPVLSVAHLVRKSNTYSRSSFAAWLYEQREAPAEVVADFERTFSGARGPRPSTRRRSTKGLENQLLIRTRRPSSPVDSGIGSSIGASSEKNFSRKLERALDLASCKDSAIGSSVAESVSEYLVQGWLIRCVAMCIDLVNTFTTDANTTEVSTTRNRSTISDAGNSAPLTIIQYPFKPLTTHHTQPLLSDVARRKIYQNLYKPLLDQQRFKKFHRIVAHTRKNRALRCLRDIEQSLIKQPVVSILYPTDRSLTNASNKTLSVTPSEFRAFGELTVQLVVDTFQHLSESEQRRVTDRAYDNGYFLDLVQQVHQLAAHIGNSTTTDTEGQSPPLDFEEVTLEGGLGETGNIAELVRWKNGQGISLRTGQVYEPQSGMKRQATAEISDDVARSMARRKKGYIPEIVDMPCTIVGCDKVFQRKCDLAKHERTHTRPFKCSDVKCKFHEHGLPTEKELDRHMNDRHNNAPKMYSCKFCEFKTKRESNCKQHMEKKHDWVYNRAKGKDKVTSLTPVQTPSTPAQDSFHMQSPASIQQSWDVSGSASSAASPLEQSMGYNNAAFTQNSGYPAPLFPRTDEDFNFNAPPLITHYSGAAAAGYDGPYLTPNSGVQHQFTPRTPAYSTITPSPMLMDDCGLHVGQPFYTDGLPTPESAIIHSRHNSAAFELVSTSMRNDVMLSGGMPIGDFTLYDNNAFAYPGASDSTLFHNQFNEPQSDCFDPMNFGDLPTMDGLHFDDMLDLEYDK